jgi:hypothetical protein
LSVSRIVLPGASVVDVLVDVDVVFGAAGTVVDVLVGVETASGASLVESSSAVAVSDRDAREGSMESSAAHATRVTAASMHPVRRRRWRP